MKVVVCFSGGVDSTTLLWDHIIQGDEIYALSVDYGQRHIKEVQCAGDIIRVHNSSVTSTDELINHKVVDLSQVGRNLMGGSSLTDHRMDVPDGHYEDETMKQTVVPNRNMLLLSLAGAWAVSLKADAVAYAAHKGDHAIYPDCRPEFIDNMGYALARCSYDPILLYAPFMEFTKAEIVRVGAKLGVPYVRTWSCYKGGYLHCGKCGTCVERKEAFRDAGVEDPTVYMSEEVHPGHGAF